ncbi:MAG: hypothetical protein KAS32_03215 [Candidatus Peribacteraceae bacterium]|nr:hypothetical protein [Candidatus Peribacteraceae bacterium]
MADFTPGPPAWNLYVSDAEGNIDFKDRDRSGGLWPSLKKDKHGKTFFTGKIGGKRIIMFQFTPRGEAKSEAEEPDW